MTALVEEMERTHGNPSYGRERKRYRGGAVPGEMTAVPVFCHLAFLHHFLKEKLPPSWNLERRIFHLFISLMKSYSISEFEARNPPPFLELPKGLDVGSIL